MKSQPQADGVIRARSHSGEYGISLRRKTYQSRRWEVTVVRLSNTRQELSRYARRFLNEQEARNYANELWRDL